MSSKHQFNKEQEKKVWFRNSYPALVSPASSRTIVDFSAASRADPPSLRTLINTKLETLGNYISTISICYSTL